MWYSPELGWRLGRLAGNFFRNFWTALIVFSTLFDAFSDTVVSSMECTATRIGTSPRNGIVGQGAGLVHGSPEQISVERSRVLFRAQLDRSAIQPCRTVIWDGCLFLAQHYCSA